MTAQPCRRWFSFSLRTLLVLLAAIGVLALSASMASQQIKIARLEAENSSLQEENIKLAKQVIAATIRAQIANDRLKQDEAKPPHDN